MNDVIALVMLRELLKPRAARSLVRQRGDGWDAYRERMGQDMRSRMVIHGNRLLSEIPIPSLADMRGKRVLVISEQGLGDELFFLRFAVNLHFASGASAVGVRINSRLLKVLRFTPNVELVSDLEAPDAWPHDVLVMAGDLPFVLGYERGQAIAPPVGIAPDMELLEKAATWPRPWLGVQWRSGSLEHMQKGAGIYKSVDFEWMRREIMDVFPGTVFALQRNPTIEEERALTSVGSKNVVNLCGWSQDIDNAAAILSALDCYIGVSNTNIHILAGLANRPRVCVLVPFPPTEWRWIQESGRSPWFPDFECWRQKPDLTWP